MKGYLLSSKKIIGYILLITAISIFTAISSIRMVDYKNDVFFNLYLAAGITQGVSPTIWEFPAIIMSLLNFTIFQLAFGRIVDIDYFECSYYILTRQKSKTNQYFKKCLILLGFSLAYNLVYYAVTWITLVSVGIPITSVFTSLALATEIIITSTLFIFIFCLLISILSIAVNRIFALYAVNLFLVISAILAIYTDFSEIPWLFKVNFIANIIPQWHIFPYVLATENPSLIFVNGFTHIFSIIYFLLLSFFLLTVGAVVINKKDVL